MWGELWCKGNAHMQEWKHKENMKAKSESIACNNNEVWPSQTVKFCKARVEAAAFCGPNKKQPSPFSLSLFLTIYAGGWGARRGDFCNLRRIQSKTPNLQKLHIIPSFFEGKERGILARGPKKMHRGISFYQGIVSI